MKKWKIYFVPHTHWDKEWYFSKNEGIIYLIDSIDKLKQLVQEKKEDYFGIVFDGQFSIVDDYLSFFPEDIKQISALIKKQKLIVGPWYTQPDTFNTSGESIVRNLLIGTSGSTHLGHSQKVAYLPDSFGFNANLPQILTLAECPMIFQWRGVNEKLLSNSLWHLWKGIDGTTIPLYNFYKPGYGNTIWAFNDCYKNWEQEELSISAKKYLEKFQTTFTDLTDWKKMSGYSNHQLCFPFGSDQFPVISNLRAFVKELNNIDSEHEWILSTFDNVAEHLLTTTNLDQLPLMTGELRYGQYSRVHRTIASSRADIKQKSKQLESLIYRHLEPLALIYEHFSGNYPQRVIEQVIKKMLECHAHDSLGGSCSDKANEQILNRLQQSEDLVNSQLTMIYRRLAQGLNLIENEEMMIVNSLVYNRDLEFECDIYTNTQNFKIINKVSQEEIKFYILEQEYRDYQNFNIISSLDPNFVYDKSQKGHFKTKIRFIIKNMLSMSYQVLQIINLPTKINYQLITTFQTAATKLISVTLNNDGTISIIDKKNPQKENIISFTAITDAGDTYDFSPNKMHPQPMQKILSQTMKFTSDNNWCHIFLNQKYEVISNLDNPKKIVQPLEIQIIINDRKIDWKIKINNQAEDIKWQWLLNTKEKNYHSFADQSFSIISRPVVNEFIDDWEKQHWKEMPVAIETMESFVYLQAKNYLTAVFTKGTNEYQVIGAEHEILAISLFRAVSYLGRRNLQYRPGRASGIDSYPYATPLSNLQKELTFELCLVLGAQKNEVARKASEWITPSCYFQLQNLDSYSNAGQSFWLAKKKVLKMPQCFSLYHNETLQKNSSLIQAVFKKSETDNNWILRFYNSSSQSIKYEPFGKMVNLLEHDFEQKNVIIANEIQTWKIDSQSLT